MAHTSVKAADGKPIAGRSPMEVDQALRDHSLPEAHFLAICALADSPPSPETKNKKTPNNTSADDPLFDSCPSCLNLIFDNMPPSPTSPLLPLLKDLQALPISSFEQLRSLTGATAQNRGIPAQIPKPSLSPLLRKRPSPSSIPQTPPIFPEHPPLPIPTSIHPSPPSTRSLMGTTAQNRGIPAQITNPTLSLI